MKYRNGDREMDHAPAPWRPTKEEVDRIIEEMRPLFGDVALRDPEARVSLPAPAPDPLTR